jgi:hypothetical protein
MLLLVGLLLAWGLSYPLRGMVQAVDAAREVGEAAKIRAKEVDRLNGSENTPAMTMPGASETPTSESHSQSQPVLLPPPAVTVRLPPARRGPPLRVGATTAQIQSVMGDPEVRSWDQHGGEVWWYGHSQIVLRDHAVVSWAEAETPLSAAR